ncbi:hypothetical protein [Streptomyces sp. MK5]|nr:hypothetical protein [Streptomyces sp. MK5]
MARRRRRPQPRDVRGRYARIPRSTPPWWFVLGVVVIGLILMYL